MQRTAIWFWVCLGLFWGLGPFSSQAIARVDFVQKYERGKIMLRRKFYFDAIKELHAAVHKTARGANHFGAHYYLAKAYYWLPDIQKAMKMLIKAKALAKNKTQKRAQNKLVRQIKALYGSLKFVPEVDPEEVGKLKFKIVPKSQFSHKHKQRYFKLFSKRLKSQGGVLLNNRLIYVPKGDYNVEIEKPQCLKYGLTEGDKIMREIAVDDAPVSITVKEKRSCGCSGGQKIYKERDRYYCACPSGMGWDKKKERCNIVGKVNPWPWILGGVGVVAVGATVTILAVVLSAEPIAEYQLAGTANTTPGTNTLRIWKQK